MLHVYRKLYSLHKNIRYLYFIKYRHYTYFDIYQIQQILPILSQKDHYLKEKKQVSRLTKDELGGKIMTEFAALKPKTYSHLRDDNEENKKVTITKKCVIKWKL